MTEDPRPKEPTWAELAERFGLAYTEGEEADLARRLAGYWISRIDDHLSAQVDEVLHADAFLQLEARWRGLLRLCQQVDELRGEKEVQLFVLDASWKEIRRDFERSGDVQTSEIFMRVYEERLGTATTPTEGESLDDWRKRTSLPFGLLIFDHELRPQADDYYVLESLSHVAAASFAPLVLGASPQLLGLSSFQQLERGISTEALLASLGPRWRSVRGKDDTRFVGLTFPRVLMRTPHAEGWASMRARSCARCGTPVRGAQPECSGCKVPLDPRRGSHYVVERDGFVYRERVRTDRDLCFGPSAFAFASVVIRSFIRTGWFVDIRGIHQPAQLLATRMPSAGGLVDAFPGPFASCDAPGVTPIFPTQVAITDELDKQLSELGLIPLTACKGAIYAAWFGNQAVQDARQILRNDDYLSARLSSMLQYVLCASRFAIMLKMRAREMVGSTRQGDDVARELEYWLNEYRCDISADDEMKRRMPLRDLSVTIKESREEPGIYQCIMRLSPHTETDALIAEVRFEAEVQGAK